jgi:transcriptional regulator with XRE-family HTH domain
MVMTAMAEVDSAWAIAVGDAIRRALGSRPQRWLAATTRLDPATVNKIVRGQQPPSLDQIDRIARALDMSRRALLSLAGYVEPDTAGRLVDLDTLPVYLREIVVASIKAGLEAEAREKGVGPVDGGLDGGG